MVKCFFAVDLGATSGRTILGYFTPQGLITEEINRFPNHLIETGGHFYWDIYELYRNIIEGLKIAGNKKIQKLFLSVSIRGSRLCMYWKRWWYIATTICIP